MRNLLFSLLLCISALSNAPAQNPLRLKLTVWADTVGPVVDIAHAGDSRMFAVGQNGIVRIVTDSQQVAVRPFLDISGQVLYLGEQGLLGMAFDPDHASNGFFYLNYISSAGGTHSRISRFKVSSDPDSADAASEEILYTVSQPYSNHKGGDLDFGPDGMLYIAFGDGGSGGDPEGHAQDLSDALGDIVRIDVSDPDTTYTVPPDNPFTGAGPDTLPEIWASGLRNPFRFGFDQLTGDLWIGDVGQNAWEEVDFWPAGGNSGPNFGWNCYEGFAFYGTPGCPIGPFVEPVAVQQNDAVPPGTWCAVVGGRVYRGTQWPHMVGRYIYTDFCAQEIRNIRPDGLGGWIDELSFEPGQNGVACIAERSDGELFMGNVGYNKIYHILDRCPMDPPVIVQNGNVLESTPAISYAWYVSGDSLPLDTNQTYEPVVSGDLYVVADLGNGCVLSSDTISFVITSTTGHAVPELIIAPNPADRLVTVTCRGGVGASYLLCDAAGRPVILGRAEPGAFTLSTDGLAPGIYGLRLLDGAGSVIARSPLAIVR